MTLHHRAMCILFGCLPWIAHAEVSVELRERIAAQYAAVDDNMLQHQYRTIAEVARPNEPDITQETEFDPRRPTGEKEQLVLVNGEPPDASAIREFNRRPQPDQRETQRIRLLLDEHSLSLVSASDQAWILDFQPILHINGEPDDDGEKFTGRLWYDAQQGYVTRVEIRAQEAFSKLLFRIRQFDVQEEFYWVEDQLLRKGYAHIMDLRNPVIDASNSVDMHFEYQGDTRVALRQRYYQSYQ